MKRLLLLVLFIPSIVLAQAVQTPTPTVVASPTATPTVVAPNISSFTTYLPTPMPVPTPGPTCQLSVRDLNPAGPARGLARNVTSSGVMVVAVGDQVSCTSGVGVCLINFAQPPTAGPWTIDQPGGLLFSASCNPSMTVTVVGQ